jgi:hypothetical protein
VTDEDAVRAGFAGAATMRAEFKWPPDRLDAYLESR